MIRGGIINTMLKFTQAEASHVLMVVRAGPAVVALFSACTTHSSLLPWWRGRIATGGWGCCARVGGKSGVHVSVTAWCDSSAVWSGDGWLRTC